MKDLRKLAEEKLNEKVQFKVNDGGVNLPLMLNAIIDAMLSFHEQASRDMFELIEWLDYECPNVEPPFEPYETADLIHDFAEKLREKLNNIQGK